MPYTAVSFIAKIDQFNPWDTAINGRHFTNFRTAIQECINGCGSTEILYSLKLRSLFDEELDAQSGFSDSYILSNDDNPGLNPNVNVPVHSNPNVQVHSLILGRDESNMRESQWEELVRTVVTIFQDAASDGPDIKDWKYCINQKLTEWSSDLESIYVDYTSKMHKFQFDPFLIKTLEFEDDTIGGVHDRADFDADKGLQFGHFEVEQVHADLSLVGCFKTVCLEFIFVALNSEENWKEKCNTKCSAEGFAYFALIGNQCKCSGTFTRSSCPEHADIKLCDIPCTTITEEFCGDGSHVRVYQSWTGEQPKELAIKLSFKIYPLLIHPALFNETMFMSAFRECSDESFVVWYRENIAAEDCGIAMELESVGLHDLWSTADASSVHHAMYCMHCLVT